MEFLKLKELFAENADPKLAESMSAYMRNQFSYFGIPTPKRRMLTTQFFETEPKNATIDWSFVFDCFDADERELQYAAVNYLEKNRNKLTKKDISNLKKIIETKSWWDTIDGLDKIVGSIALKDVSVNEILLKWSNNDNFWLRRIAIDHQLNRKEKTNIELLAEIIKNNFGQTEFFINKAIGWSLREYSKTNPDWVRKFVAENQDKMAKLSIREASKYI